MALDTLLYVKETPWKGLGTSFETQPTTAEEIVKKAQLDWVVMFLPMMTELHPTVDNYKAIYREDNNQVLGVVNNRNPVIVQNADMFNAFNYLLGKNVDAETASVFDSGRYTFGTFKVNEPYKILDDEVDHYFVVVNDHLKPDGKISVMNTPVRVVCQNAIESAIRKSFYHLRVPITGDASIDKSVSYTIIDSATDAMLDLQKRAEEMVRKKIDRTYLDKILDELFPFTQADDDSILHSKANEGVEIVRETFISQCLHAENLMNYHGTQWAMYNAVVDFHQHYIKNVSKAYDLGYRMKKLTGVGVPTEVNTVAKYLQVADKLLAA